MVQKRKLPLVEEDYWDDNLEPVNPNAYTYDLCLIGTSMVKNIETNKLLPNKRCFFKSISGGCIRDVWNALKSREALLRGCKIFVITCGSNDCDSTRDLKTTINDFLELAQYLSKLYPDSKLIFNKLIPRTKTRYTQIEEFEKRRICFNNFLESTLTLLVPSVIVTHEKFESVHDLDMLLVDGVHMNPLHGVPIYIENIKKTIENLVY